MYTLNYNLNIPFKLWKLFFKVYFKLKNVYSTLSKQIRENMYVNESVLILTTKVFMQ